jgi:hypothetical protein
MSNTPEEILGNIYKSYASDSGVLFGIKEKSAVKAIIEFTIRRLEPPAVPDEKRFTNESITPVGEQSWASTPSAPMNDAVERHAIEFANFIGDRPIPEYSKSTNKWRWWSNEKRDYEYATTEQLYKIFRPNAGSGDKWYELAKAAEEVIKVMNVPKNQPILDNTQFELFQERYGKWQALKSNKS